MTANKNSYIEDSLREFDDTFEAMLPYDGICYKDYNKGGLDDLEPIKDFLRSKLEGMISEIEKYLEDKSDELDKGWFEESGLKEEIATNYHYGMLDLKIPLRKKLAELKGD